MTSTLALEATNLSKRYGQTYALADVSLDIREGEIHALVGANGAGKSTLLKVIAGVHRPTSGTLRIRGEDVEPKSPADAIRLGIGTIHQQLELAPDLTVAENIILGNEDGLLTRFGTINRRAADKTASEAFQQLNVSVPLDKRVADLDYSTQQLVAIARTLVQDCDVLVLDEPTAAINAKAVEDLHRLLVRLKSLGKSIIYVSHFLDQVFSLADRITVLRDGRKTLTTPIADATLATVVDSMVGQLERPPSKRNRNTMPNDPLLTLQSFAVRGKAYVEELTIMPGEIIGLTGLLGSGHSDLVHSLAGANGGKYSGAATFAGAILKPGSYAGRVKDGIMLLPADRLRLGIFTNRAVFENVQVSKSVIQRAVHRRPGRERREAKRLIDLVNCVPNDIDTPIGLLSGGNQQRAMLARALGSRPRLLLVEEPTQGVDIKGKTAIHAYLRKIADEGAAVVVASSDYEELMDLTSRLAIFKNGAMTKLINTSEESLSSLADAVHR